MNGKNTLAERLELLALRGEIARSRYVSMPIEEARRVLALSTRLTWSEAGDTWARVTMLPDGARRGADHPVL